MEILGKPSKQRTEVRQASLIEAALALAAQHSPADITTADLAKAVCISQGAVFKHFASKEAIWLAVLDWVSAELMQRLQTAAQGQSGLAALQAVFGAHVDFVVAWPGVPRVIFQELQTAHDSALKVRVRALMQQYRQLLLQLLTQAQAQNSIHQDTDLQAAAVLLIGSVQGLVMQSLIAGDVAGIQTQAPGVLHLYLRALGAPLHANAQGQP